jgi:hypothetical protein
MTVRVVLVPVCAVRTPPFRRQAICSEVLYARRAGIFAPRFLRAACLALSCTGSASSAEKVIHTFMGFAYGVEPSASSVADTEEEGAAGGE